MFNLTIRTPQENIYDGEIESITLTSDDGDMQLFENHASITATVTFSPVLIEQKGKEEHFLVRNGIFFFDNDQNSASLLVLHCEKKSEMSFELVQDYANFIEKQIKEGKDLSEFQIKFLEGEKLAVEQQLEESK